jgi:predicted MFS family arabinose efflux permease
MFLVGASGAVVFGLLGAVAPNVVVLLIARAGIGVAFAFLSALSLAIMNAVFAPEKRAIAIAWFLAAIYILGVLPGTLGGMLAERIGWRAGALVTPVLAIIVVALTMRYVPETHRSHRGIDVLGLLLVAVALVGVMYGTAQLKNGVHPGAIAPLLVGIGAGAAFLWWELRSDDPALDLRIFRSRRFTAAVTAGAANNLVQGGSGIMVIFYLVVVRDQPTWIVAILMIPATLLSALASLGAGRAAARIGDCAVLVAGLSVLAVSLLLRLLFGLDTPIVAVGAVMALMMIGGAIVQTPQTTVMMSSAPPELGGVVSAVKAAVGSSFNGLGSSLFAMVAIVLSYVDLGPDLAGTGITAEQAGALLSAGDAAPTGPALDSARTQWVISEVTSSVLEAADAMNVLMALIAMGAAAAVLVLFRRTSPH